MANYVSKHTGAAIDAAVEKVPVIEKNVAALNEEIRKQTGSTRPQMFGAVGDGIADDTDAIQAALDMGGEVYIPTGRYKITRTLFIGSNTSVFGDGDGTVIFLGDNGANLTPHYWYPDEIEPTYPDYYPYITTRENAHSIRIAWLRVEGNTEKASTNIHVGICAESATNVVVEHVSVWKINYFPQNAPPRPSGQWRTGWNVAFLRCNLVELAHSVIQYGGYECVRVGPFTNSIWTHDCRIEYGWRTGFQIIRGCSHVVFERCIINQDDFDAYDTNACFTLHSSDDDRIADVLIRDCEMNCKLFSGTAGGAAISQVYHTTDLLTIDNTTINVVADDLPAVMAKGTVQIWKSKLSTNSYYTIVAEATSKVIIEDTIIECTSPNRAGLFSMGDMEINRCNIKTANNCVYVIPSSGVDVHLIVKNSTLETSNASSSNAICVQKTTAHGNVSSFEIIGNTINSKIYIDQTGRTVSRKCTIADNNINASSSSRGVQIPSTATTQYKLLTIRDNIVAQGTDGILLNSAGTAVITGNDVSGCKNGITATNEKNIIKDNILPATT